MMKSKFMTLCLLIIYQVFFGQNLEPYTTVKTNTIEVKIPGKWTQLNTMDVSGQTYLQNDNKIIIAVAENLKNKYPFFKKGLSDYKNVQEFYKWDSDYRKELKFKTDKIKEDSKTECIIWKYNDGELDNVFLFGSIKDNFINLLVYTNEWNEDEKIKFLENIFELNK